MDRRLEPIGATRMDFPDVPVQEIIEPQQILYHTVQDQYLVIKCKVLIDRAYMSAVVGREGTVAYRMKDGDPLVQLGELWGDRDGGYMKIALFLTKSEEHIVTVVSRHPTERRALTLKGSAEFANIVEVNVGGSAIIQPVLEDAKRVHIAASVRNPGGFATPARLRVDIGDGVPLEAAGVHFASITPALRNFSARPTIRINNLGPITPYSELGLSIRPEPFRAEPPVQCLQYPDERSFVEAM